MSLLPKKEYQPSKNSLSSSSLGSNPPRALPNIELYSQFRENALQNQLNGLRDNFLIIKANNTSPSVDEESENQFPSINSQSKTLIRNTMVQIVETLEEKLRHNNTYQLLPQSFFEQQIETIRSTFEKNLNKAKNCLAKGNVPQPEEKKVLEKKYCRGKFKLPKSAKEVLHEWYIHNTEDPYPTYEQKMELAEQAQITMKQVNNWFINMRGRTSTKPYKSTDFNYQIQKKLEVEPKM